MSQENRKYIYLPPDHFRIIEHSFVDHCSLAYDISELIRSFPQSHPKSRMTWDHFFSSDETILAASVIRYNLAALEKGFSQAIKDKKDPVYIAKQFNLYTAALLVEWHQKLSSCKGIIGTYIRTMFHETNKKKLLHEWLKLHRFCEKNGINMDTSIFSHAFWLQSSENSGMTDPLEQKKGDWYSMITANFYVFYNAVTTIQQSVQNYFNETFSSGNHSPDIGLFLTFLKLYQHPVDRLNTFTERYTRFYYDRILHTKPLPAKPDEAVLTFTCSKDIQETHIPLGQRFRIQSSPDTKPVEYVSQNQQRIVPAAIDKVYTLYFERDRFCWPEYELGYYTGIKKIDVMNEQCSNELRNWPVLGYSSQKCDTQHYTDADMGFALSSPVLLLKEGERTVTVTISFTQQSWNILESAINVISQKYTEPDTHEVDTNDAYFRMIGKMFTIALTAENGWYTVEEYSFLPLPQDTNTHKSRALVLQFHLCAHAPAIINYSEELHRSCIAAHMPVMKLLINHNNYVYPYSILSKMFVEDICIEVTVNGVKNLHLYNDSGQVDPSTAFAPFGPTPVKGSSFIIGCHELLCKNIINTDITVTWGNIPQCRQGFAEYYEQYDQQFTTDSFRMTVTALQNGSWIPADTKEQIAFNVFQNETVYENDHTVQTDRIAQTSSYRAIRIAGMQPDPVLVTEDEFGYTLNAKSGYFRLSLSAPDDAFGHAVYQHVLSRVLLENSKLKQFKPAPNPPYTPIIKEISLNYTASDSIALTNEAQRFNQLDHSFFHIHPFGYTKVTVDTTSDTASEAHVQYAKSQECMKQYHHCMENNNMTECIDSLQKAIDHLADTYMLVAKPHCGDRINDALVHLKNACIQIRQYNDTKKENGKMYIRQMENDYDVLSDQIGMELSNGRLSLVPFYEHQGNCFIGIRPADIFGSLSIYFNLRNDAYHRLECEDSSVQWSYLHENHWIPLDNDALISDTTCGFLKDGIVVLNIPQRNYVHHTCMPADYLWLKASAGLNAEHRCSAQGIVLNAVAVRRVITDMDNTDIPPCVAANSINEIPDALPGINSLQQPNPSYGGRAAENEFERNLRIRQRIIHRNRAVLPHDYELLILENFPEIFKAKCFSNMSIEAYRRSNTIHKPGTVLCVVVPKFVFNKEEHDERLYCNTLKLKEIRNLLQKYSSPFVTVETANPFYEQIQIRCRAQFTAIEETGSFISKLNKVISAYISPWYTEGNVLSFGWELRRHDIQNYILDLPFVDFVTDFSMLHITDAAFQEYNLYDTEAAEIRRKTYHLQKSSAVTGSDYSVSKPVHTIKPLFPWSLPLPMKSHYLNSLTMPVSIHPEPIGLKDMQIGNTFIIQRN